MPNNFSLFTRDTTLDELNNRVDNIIKQIKTIPTSAEHECDKSILLSLIQDRQTSFCESYRTTTHASLKHEFNQGYDTFVNHLEHAIQTPNKSPDDLAHYHHSNNYTFAGGFNAKNSKTFDDKIAKSCFIASLFLLTMSLGLFPLSFPASMILFALSLNMLIPSALYYFGETRVNRALVQKDENRLFKLIPDVINITPIPSELRP